MTLHLPIFTFTPDIFTISTFFNYAFPFSTISTFNTDVFPVPISGCTLRRDVSAADLSHCAPHSPPPPVLAYSRSSVTAPALQVPPAQARRLLSMRRPRTSLEEALKKGSDSSEEEEEGAAGYKLHIQALERAILAQPLDYGSHIVQSTDDQMGILLLISSKSGSSVFRSASTEEQSTDVIRQLNESNAKFRTERDLLRVKIVESAEQQE
ncbi:hypothetical protein TRIUR3_30306 [Triticum urartu]|uniref:Uncharacterized protein n=1 Tax=Triticum urartu TaxID=4572 RepID=M7ZAU7_TRIUA|nr:hypothetical protein TRIUR3_30306 [Triticum urartu]